MPSKAGILCVDFGTSSIRAALTDDARSRPRALELGEAFRSSIDRASIPSAIFIDADGSKISFGEEAFKKGLRGDKSLLFEMSPKRWMTAEAPEMLDRELFAGSGITRKHLLAGLLGQSFSAISTAARLSKTALLELETRVAHPVWNPDVKPKLQRHLASMTHIGQQISGFTDLAISPDKLLSAISAARGNKTAPLILDVEEPVAAALELFDNTDNSREICVVVDVGAGTTDLGIFLSLTPDERSTWARRKFIQAAPPRSIYMAGDLIDAEVIKLIKNRARNLGADGMLDLQRRRRNIKETLFSPAQKIFEVGVEVKLSDLEKQVQILRMCGELSANFKGLIDDASSFIERFVEARFHQADRINVVFAGGGGKIGFLQKAIGESARLANGRSVPVVVRSAAAAETNLPAAVERLAVALGGTTPKDFWPVTTLSAPGDLTTVWDRERGLSLWRASGPETDWWREQD